MNNRNWQDLTLYELLGRKVKYVGSSRYHLRGKVGTIEQAPQRHNWGVKFPGVAALEWGPPGAAWELVEETSEPDPIIDKIDSEIARLLQEISDREDRIKALRGAREIITGL